MGLVSVPNKTLREARRRMKEDDALGTLFDVCVDVKLERQLKNNVIIKAFSNGLLINQKKKSGGRKKSVKEINIDLFGGFGL